MEFLYAQTGMILLPLLLIAQSSVVRLQAQSATTPAAGFSGLDVTILLDQSGSMWQNPRNDRYAHRIGQSKNLIYRLAEHVEGTPLVHRLSVIDFGDTASVSLSNHVMRYNPSDPGSALRDTKAVIERVVIERPLRNTNTADAHAPRPEGIRKDGCGPGVAGPAAGTSCDHRWSS